MDYPTFILAGLWNKPGRNLATVFCFAFIAANIFSGQFLIAGAGSSIDRGISRMGADQLVVPAQYMVFLQGAGPSNTVAIIMAEPSGYRIRADIMEQIGKLKNVTAVSPQLYVATLVLPALSKEPVNFYGIDPATDFTIQPWLEKPLEHPLRSGEVIIGHSIAGEISKKISVAGSVYTIVGRLDPTQSTVDNTIFLRLDDAYALSATPGIIPPSLPKIAPGDVNAVLIRNSPKENLDVMTTRVRRSFALSADSENIRVIGKHFSLDPASEDIRAIPGLLNVISIFITLIALPLIAVVAAMVAHERQREIGLLKAMGAKRAVVFFLSMAESLVLAVTGGIIGIGMSFFTLLLLNALGILSGALQVSFRFPSVMESSGMAALALLVVIAIGSIASLWPAYQSSRMNPYDAIRAE
jgi:putative ABC transport system permease protein